MELGNPDCETCFLWLKSHTEINPKENIAHNISTWSLYEEYQQWARKNGFGLVSDKIFWECIQLIYPEVQIIGPRGNRIFSGIKIK